MTDCEDGRLVFTPRTLKGRRLSMHISAADAAKMKSGRRWTAVIRNLDNGQDYRAMGAECGLPTCFCDAVVVPLRVKRRKGAAPKSRGAV
jgi:hypothetical protein